MAKKSIIYIFTTVLLFVACAKKETTTESQDFAKRIEALQVGREGSNNNFVASMTFKHPQDETLETITFKGNFSTEKKTYKLNADDNKPFVLHIECNEKDALCNDSTVKIEGLSSSPIPGTVTVEQYCIENADFSASLLSGDYNSDVYDPVMKELALDIREASNNNEILPQRLLLRRVQNTDKHFFNLSFYKIEDVNSTKVYQFRGIEGDDHISTYRYFIVNGNSRLLLENKMNSSSKIERHSVDNNFMYNFLLKFIDAPNGHISPVLKINIDALTGGFQSNDDDNRLAPSIFDFI